MKTNYSTTKDGQQIAEEHYEILNKMKWYYASMPIIDDYYNITKEELERVREQGKITALFLDLQRAILEFKHKGIDEYDKDEDRLDDEIDDSQYYPSDEDFEDLRDSE